MKKNLTEMVFLLDRSGSMDGLEGDTIGGFNSLIEKQKKEDGEAYVTTVLFDHSTEMLHDRVPLSKIAPLSAEQYYVRGSTALLDALGATVNHIAAIQKYAKEEDRPEHTLFVITTDGMENASHEYTRDQIRALIDRQQKEHGWEFLFLGANIDAMETASSYGIPLYMAANYRADAVGTHAVYEAVCKRVSMSRKNMGCCDRAWAEELDEDYLRREKKADSPIVPNPAPDKKSGRPMFLNRIKKTASHRSGALPAKRQGGRCFSVATDNKL